LNLQLSRSWPSNLIKDRSVGRHLISGFQLRVFSLARWAVTLPNITRQQQSNKQRIREPIPSFYIQSMVTVELCARSLLYSLQNPAPTIQWEKGFDRRLVEPNFSIWLPGSALAPEASPVHISAVAIQWKKESSAGAQFSISNLTPQMTLAEPLLADSRYSPVKGVDTSDRTPWV
jgi:hypothetical protein